MSFMVELTLSPILRPDCIIHTPSTFLSKLDFKENDFLIFLASEERSHSFVQRVMAIKIDESISFPFAEVDSRQAAPLTSGAKCTVVVTDIPEAKVINLLALDSYSFTKGNWSEIARDGNIDFCVDLGDRFSYIFPSQISDPYVVSSTVESTIPPAPVRVSESTIIQVTKVSQTEIQDIQLKAYHDRSLRCETYLESLSNNWHDLLSDIRNEHADSVSAIYDYVQPSDLVYQLLANFLKKGMKEYESNKTLTESGYFVGSLSYINDKLDIPYVIDAQVVGQHGKGKVVLFIYSSAGKSQLYLDKIDREIVTLLSATKEKQELIRGFCIGCGAPLDLTSVSSEGIVYCTEGCKTAQRLPTHMRVLAKNRS
ncbi:MAG: hypothetical protein ACTSYA_01205 [Candidatus Kariarchaeaceae archaeon]